MSSLTLTIGGSNFLPQYVTGSAKIVSQLQSRSNVLNLRITKTPGQSKPTEGTEIILKDGSRFLFGGFITRVRPKETQVGQHFSYEVEATDYTYILNNKVAQISYSGMTLSDIVDDLLSNYVDAGYSLTTNNVDTGPVITTISFNLIDLRKCFEKLSALTGYSWWIDFERDIHFVADDSALAPESFTDASSLNFIDVNIDTEMTQIRNFIYVKGGVEETTNYQDQDIKGDGTAVSFFIDQSPTQVQYIKLNGVTKTFGQDPDDETGKYFMYSAKEKYVRVVAGNPTPSSSDIITISYKYNVPIIVPMQSSASVLAMKALEGGDGIHSYTIDDSSISSKDEARQRAVKELIQFANPLINGVINTRTGLLSAGSYFIPGQQLTLNLPVWGISSDTAFLIQEVQTTLIESGSQIEYNYSIRFGGRLLNAVSFLESLVVKESPIEDAAEIVPVKLVAEETIQAEVITRNPKTFSVAESTTQAESLSQTKTTPPFKWGVTGTKPGVWGKSEWG